MAARLRVSRVTLRAAIGALREAGYLRSQRGRGGGTFVVSAAGTSASDARRPDATALARGMGATLHDALDYRRVLEPGAAALAATRALPAADRAHLAGCVAGARERDIAVRRRGDSRLHLAIAAASGSVSVAQAIADVQLRLDHLLGAIPARWRNRDHADAQHTAIVAAILAGDPVGARTVMEEHCDGTAALLRGLLD
ncbi:MAG: hypothetical protein QOI74_2126 [Micromonosporaceae bacterium]|nr:hypothetical protein [Micromonosporaceae bacterium]